jgi:hypothetical protein
MDGALMEIGPYRVTKDGNLKYNNGSWDEFANLLFVDQPVGTGFSYVNTDSYLTDLEQMAEHMVLFLEKWFALFPEYEQDDVSWVHMRHVRLLTTNSSISQANHTPASISLTLPGRSSNGTRRMQSKHGRSRVCSLEMDGYRRSINISPISRLHTRTVL